MVRRALVRKTRWYQNRCSTFKIKDFNRPKNVSKKIGILTPGDLNFDLSQKMTEMISKMIFRELSNAVFRFVLRCAGAEIDGGCSNTDRK